MEKAWYLEYLLLIALCFDNLYDVFWYWYLLLASEDQEWRESGNYQEAVEYKVGIHQGSFN